MPGPPPKIDPVRRHPRTGPLKLPAQGREGEPPPWPIPEDRTPAEADRLWRELWATPQAVAWERLGWTRVVARYALVLLDAERLNKDSLAEARQLEDRLGLTPKAMRLLLWEVASDEVGEQRQSRKGARGRIKAVG